MKQNTKPTVAEIKAEVIAAYNESTRNLNFKASGAVAIDEAVTIIAKALNCDEDAGGYNNFKPSCFRKLPAGTKITLARENSVCAYIKPPKGVILQEAKLVRAMMIDEWSKESDGTYRIWFD